MSLRQSGRVGPFRGSSAEPAVGGSVGLRAPVLGILYDASMSECRMGAKTEQNPNCSSLVDVNKAVFNLEN